MTKDEALSALANIGITKYRITDKAAFLESSNGRRVTVTAWDDDVTPNDIAAIKAEFAKLPVTTNLSRMDVDPRTGGHVDRAKQIARAKLSAARKRAKKQARRAVQSQ